MNKKRTRLKPNTIFILLVISAVTVEVINIIYSLSVGSAQANVCPKSDEPTQISISLSVIALILTVLIPFFRKKTYYLINYTGVSILLIIVGGFYLGLMAGGGLDWCEFHGK